MDYARLYTNDRKSRLPEGMMAISVSLRLRFGAIVATQGKQPVRGRVMSRRTARTLVRTGRLVVNGVDRRDDRTRLNGTRMSHMGVHAVKAVLVRSARRCRRGTAYYVRDLGINAFEYPLLMRLATMGLCVMVSANDRVTRYLGLEWQSLCLYVRAAFRRGSAYSTEAGLKYYIMGSVASGRLLFGSSLIYGYTGTVNFGERERRRLDMNVSNHVGLVAGMRRLRVGLRFKLAAAPFHAWSPDVYEGAPTPSTMYFAVVPKVGILRLRCRLCMGPFVERYGKWQTRMRGTGIRSRAVATMAARMQRRRKRFLAYSSVGHVGYMLLGLGTGTLEGIQSVMLYVMIYIVMGVNLWLVRMSLNSVSVSTLGEEKGSVVIEHQGRLTSGRKPAKYRTDIGGLNQVNPRLARSISRTMFSMAGVPPLAGFGAKRRVFRSRTEQSRYRFAVAGRLRSCISAYYYLRWIKIMYFDPAQNLERDPVKPEVAIRLGLSLGIRVFFFAYPGPRLRRTHHMSLLICG